MTEASRVQHVAQALAAISASSAPKETLRIEISGSSQLLPVVEIPLDVPVLNAQSFRIAPQLADHPLAAEIAKDPNSAESQRAVAELVRTSHRYAEALKDSLKDDGQGQPGVITRSGKLINANTRCVLLRELRDEGLSKIATIRVAILPVDFTNEQELELESVLQKQREHKDDYNLVSELMMIKKLHDDAKMSDAQISRLLRLGGDAKVRELRAALVLMERARRLVGSTPLPLSEFVSEQDKKENWLGLLSRVRGIDASEGRAAGDDHVRRWLIAYLSGWDSVHILRHAVGDWVEADVIADLATGNTTAVSVSAAATTVSATAGPTVGDDPSATSKPGADTASSPAAPAAGAPAGDPDGLDLLGDEPDTPRGASTLTVQRVLDITVAAKNGGEVNITLPDGTTAPAADVRAALSESVKRGLDAVKRRQAAGSRIRRPATSLTQARNNLRDALDALDEVGDDAGFLAIREETVALADDITGLLSEIKAALAEAADIPADGDDE
ncbi:MAG TPA: hypothetical protein VF557_11635 [Jatrophihabitans sp.]|jgi:hypothetical protein|uniref:hypothetical protein n=1 Tax=Jatrophihabitans sp. TaxID=1932789 RepID=UPI002F10F31C